MRLAVRHHSAALSPIAAFTQVCDRPGVAFLDGGAGNLGRSFLAWSPVERLEIDIRGRSEPRTSSGDAPLEAIEGFVRRHHARRRTVIGALSYDLRRWIEPTAGGPPRGRRPLAVLHAYDRVLSFEAPSLDTANPPDPRAGTSEARPPLLGHGVALVDRPSYRRMYARIRRALLDGEIYQANLAIAFEAELHGTASELYRRLAVEHPVPYGAYLDCGGFQILNNSPELLLHRRDLRLTTRPIKGTRPRGRDDAEDRRLRDQLRGDAKENAEHVMIVDLERNDLGRIAVRGSVAVTELANCVTYPTLHHLESTVTAELRTGVSLAELLRATFPGGSITGAPKIRAMRVIDEVEPEAREFYTGAIIHLPPSGELTASVAIRCAIAEAGRLRYFAGGGIVIDSDPEAEYDECLLKAAAVFAAGGSTVHDERGSA